jgi:filamentous hemagglutinin family protein
MNSRLFPIALLCSLCTAPLATAQTITPASDGTGTIATPNGDRISITGGSLSADHLNLFHSFESFGLTAAQTATFFSDPQVMNILSRVVGGDASLINGLLEVVGSDANLYLINPAGIVFGSQARLNVGGDFFATTADGIGLRDGGWFDAVGAMDYGSLTGTPFQFRFGQAEPGAVVNSGDLAVPTGQRLGLIGGTVINMGSLTASAGEVLITAVPGENILRLSQPGQLLSLEIPAEDLTATTIAPLNLPSLLTGGDVTVTSTGTLKLQSTQKEIPIAPGLTVHNGAIAVNGEMGGTVVIGGEAIALSGATINASGNNGGGTVLIGGEQQGSGSMPRANFTVIDETSTIRADALDQGDGGRVILWADDTTQFYGDISARGGENGGDGGFVEVSGAENLAFRGRVDTAAPQGEMGSVLLDPTNITIRAGAGVSGFTGSLLFADPGPTDIFESELEAITGGITLQATNDIIFEDAADDNFNLALASGPIAFTAGRNITMNDTDDVIQAQANLTFTAGGNLVLGSLQTSSGMGPTGAIAITAGGSVTAEDLDTSVLNGGQAGAVTVTAGGPITLEEIDTSSNSASSTAALAGDVTLTTSALSGNIEFEQITTTATNSPVYSSIGGNVMIAARGTVQGTSIETAGVTAGVSTSGSVSITHDGGPDNVDFEIGDDSVNGVQVISTTGAIANQIVPMTANGSTVTVGPQTTITSVNSPPTIQGFSVTTAVGQPVQFTAQDLAAQVSDVDGDTITTLTLSNLITTGTFTLNGVTISDRTTPITLNPGDVITFIPDSTLTGTVTLFDLNGGDRISTETASITTTSTSDFNTCPPFCDQTLDPLDSLTPLDTSQFTNLEEQFTTAFTTHLGLPSPDPVSLDQARELLRSVERRTGVKPALLYLSFTPNRITTGERDRTKAHGKDPAYPALAQGGTSTQFTEENATLDLLLITGDEEEKPIRVPMLGVTQENVTQLARQMQRGVQSVTSNAYQRSARQLYDWLIAPIEAALQAREVEHLAILPDQGLRSLPFAALMQDQQFLIERYSLSMMPSLSLSLFEYSDVADLSVLAMGADTFTDQAPLPAVPSELDIIANQLWPGTILLNPDFTPANAITQRDRTPYGIIHMATHGEFEPGAIGNSYLQFWGDQQLSLDQIRMLNFHQPMVDLLVLSACRTVLGDAEAELGFAGLAVAAGVKTSLGSLWYVSDEGTLGLMSSFYQSLKTAPIRAQALQQAQLAMLRGEVVLEGGELRSPTATFSLPGNLTPSRQFQHPYYWSSFVMVGSPW